MIPDSRFWILDSGKKESGPGFRTKYCSLESGMHDGRYVVNLAAFSIGNPELGVQVVDDA